MTKRSPNFAVIRRTSLARRSFVLHPPCLALVRVRVRVRPDPAARGNHLGTALALGKDTEMMMAIETTTARLDDVLVVQTRMTDINGDTSEILTGRRIGAQVGSAKRSQYRQVIL